MKKIVNLFKIIVLANCLLSFALIANAQNERTVKGKGIIIEETNTLVNQVEVFGVNSFEGRVQGEDGWWGYIRCYVSTSTWEVHLYIYLNDNVKDLDITVKDVEGKVKGYAQKNYYDNCIHIGINIAGLPYYAQILLLQGTVTTTDSKVHAVDSQIQVIWE